MTTIKQLLARRDRTTPAAVLAEDSLNALRYEALRGLLPKYFREIHANAVLYHRSDETFEQAFDRMVDVRILTEHAREKEHA